MKTDLRLKFLLLLRDLFKVPEGVVVPWLNVIRNILYPLRAMYERNSKIHYDFYKDIYIIEGQTYSGNFFKNFYLKKCETKTVKIYKDEYGVILTEIQ